MQRVGDKLQLRLEQRLGVVGYGDGAAEPRIAEQRPHPCKQKGGKTVAHRRGHQRVRRLSRRPRPIRGPFVAATALVGLRLTVLRRRDKGHPRGAVADVGMLAAGCVPGLGQLAQHLRLLELQEPQLPAHARVARQGRSHQAHNGRQQETVGGGELEQRRRVAQGADAPRDHVAQHQPSGAGELPAREREEVAEFRSREILDHRVDHDGVDGAGGEVGELLRADDGDIRAAGVAGSQPLPHRRRALAQVEMAAAGRHRLGARRIPAAVIHDPRVRTGHVAQKIVGDQLVVHALVAVADVDRRLSVPELDPGHSVTTVLQRARSPSLEGRVSRRML